MKIILYKSTSFLIKSKKSRINILVNDETVDYHEKIKTYLKISIIIIQCYKWLWSVSQTGKEKINWVNKNFSISDDICANYKIKWKFLRVKKIFHKGSYKRYFCKRIK